MTGSTSEDRSGRCSVGGFAILSLSLSHTMDFSNLTLPFFLEPLRLIPYYNARLADLLERVRAAYRQWIDRGRNQSV